MSPRSMLSLLLVAAGVASSRAQSFNLDAGIELGLPADTYGGAANSPGAWQVLDFNVAQTVSLVTLDGEEPGVTITASLPFGPAFALHDGPSGDAEKLLEDYLDLHSTPATFEIAGLAPGRYQIWTYAWAPDNDAYVTLVSVNDDNRGVGGAWPGDLVEFVTHAVHEVEVAELELVVVSVMGIDKGTLNGMQLVRLPDDPPPVGDPQGFNLDAGLTFGEPSRGWGGAAGQTGVWMPLSFHAENPVTLHGLDGEATTVKVGANLPFGPASFAHDGPTGDEEKLLEDYLDLHSTGGTFSFTGVPAGDYLVYTYAWGPDNAAFTTNVTIGDDTQTIGGAWPGTLSEGVTHARHAVTVPPSGKLAIHTFGTKGTLNGIQLLPVADAPVEPPEVAPEAVEEDPFVEADPAAEVVAEDTAVAEDPVAEVVEPGPEPDVVEAEAEGDAPAHAEPGPESDLAVRGGGGDDGCHGGAPGLLVPALAIVACARRRRAL